MVPSWNSSIWGIRKIDFFGSLKNIIFSDFLFFFCSLRFEMGRWIHAVDVLMHDGWVNGWMCFLQLTQNPILIHEWKDRALPPPMTHRGYKLQAWVKMGFWASWRNHIHPSTHPPCISTSTTCIHLPISNLSEPKKYKKYKKFIFF